jgi:hypothetical protein
MKDRISNRRRLGGKQFGDGPYVIRKIRLHRERHRSVLWTQQEVRRGWRDPELVPLFASIIQTKPSADLTSLEASLENMRSAVSR